MIDLFLYSKSYAELQGYRIEKAALLPDANDEIGAIDQSRSIKIADQAFLALESFQQY